MFVCLFICLSIIWDYFESVLKIDMGEGQAVYGGVRGTEAVKTGLEFSRS